MVAEMFSIKQDKTVLLQVYLVLQMAFLDSKSWQQGVGTCSGASGLLNRTVIYTHIMAEQPEDNRD